MKQGEDKLSKLIDMTYGVLDAEEIFSTAKESSWQTFFHHSVSVAAISYRLGEAIKNSAINSGMIEVSDAIEYIESSMGANYEEILFLAGIAHDYIKIRGWDNGERSSPEDRMGEVLRNLYKEIGVKTDQAVIDKAIEDLLKIARAVEAVNTPGLGTPYLIYISKVVRIADLLMSVRSIDDAIQHILLDRQIEEELSKFGLKIGYLRLSVPSLLQIEVSSEIMDLLREKGWTPLAIYYDGAVLAGSLESSEASVEEVIERVRKKAAEILNMRLREAIEEISRKPLTKACGYMLKSKGDSLTDIITEDKDMDKKEKTAIELFLTITRYLRGEENVSPEIRLDPRRIATGIGKGSTYFEDLLSSTAISKEELERCIVSIGKCASISDDRYEQEKARLAFLLYMTAYASEDEEKVREIIKRLTRKDIGIGRDRKNIRLAAMAEIFKMYISMPKEDVVKKIVDTVYEVLGGSLNIDSYIKSFVLERISSNIIDGQEILKQRNLETLRSADSYCRVCNRPIYGKTVRFINYGEIAKGKGASSEIWLPDDPPLARLESLTTNRDTSVRHVCPLCLCEASLLGNIYRPPFLILAMHPVVSYDLWRWITNRIGLVQPDEELYEKLLNEPKMTKDEIMEKSKERGETRLLIDSAGARIIIPLGIPGETSYLSLDVKHTAYMLALAPIYMTIAGGGQVSLVSTVSSVYNLGVGTSPILIPHPSKLIESVLEPFETILRLSRIKREEPDYSVYNKAYLALMTTLLIYGYRIFAWYKPGKKRSIEGYSLEMFKFMDSLSYLPIALLSIPPESLDPRVGVADSKKNLRKDRWSEQYRLIYKKTNWVERILVRAIRTVEGGEKR